MGLVGWWSPVDHQPTIQHTNPPTPPARQLASSTPTIPPASPPASRPASWLAGGLVGCWADRPRAGRAPKHQPLLSRSAGLGRSLFNYLHRRLGPGKGPGRSDFDVFWGGLGSILEDFGSHFEGLEGLKASVEVQEPPGRGPRATRNASGRHRVVPGPTREALLFPTWSQHGPILGPKVEQESIRRRCEKA